MANDKSTNAVSAIGSSDKRDRFIKAAESRVNKALKAIDLVFSITSAELYMYSNNDVKAIIGAFNEKIESLNAAFANKGPVAEGFTLEK